MGLGVGIYDEAISKKIGSWVNKDIMILKPNETSRLWKITDDKNNDKPLTLPLIAISRFPDIEIKWTGNTPLSKLGETINCSTTSGKFVQLTAIPIDISYQLDIYTRHFDEADNYVREFIFNLINYPKLEVKVALNGVEFVHNCSIEIMSTVSDNSDISERLISGQFTRFTLDFKVIGANLYSVPVVQGYKVDVENSQVNVTFGDELSAEEEKN